MSDEPSNEDMAKIAGGLAKTLTLEGNALANRMFSAAAAGFGMTAGILHKDESRPDLKARSLVFMVSGDVPDEVLESIVTYAMKVLDECEADRSKNGGVVKVIPYNPHEVFGTKPIDPDMAPPSQ